MGEFIKRCGIGLLTIITSPLWLAVFLLYVLYGTIMLIFSPLCLLIRQINGKRLSIKDKYDQKADAILKGYPSAQQNSVSAPIQAVYTQNQPVQSTNYPNNTSAPQQTYYPSNSPVYGNGQYLPPQQNVQQLPQANQQNPNSSQQNPYNINNNNGGNK